MGSEMCIRDRDKKVNEPQENEEICEEIDCDFCGSTKQVGFVDDALTLKVCEDCDVDGKNFEPKLWIRPPVTEFGDDH